MVLNTYLFLVHAAYCVLVPDMDHVSGVIVVSIIFIAQTRAGR